MDTQLVQTLGNDPRVGAPPFHKKSLKLITYLYTWCAISKESTQLFLI